MRFLRAGILVCALLLLLAQHLPASPPQISQNQSTANLQAVLLLQQSLHALAGNASIADVTLTGTARRVAGADDETGTAVLKALVTGGASLNVSFPSGTLSEIRTNSEKGPVGQWIGPDSKAHSMSQHNLLTDSSWFFPVLTLSKVLASQGYVIGTAGLESKNGQAVEHITISQPPQSANSLPDVAAAMLQHLSQMEIYLDSATGVPVSLLFNTHPDNDAGLDMPMEIRFSDYRSVNGTQVPFHVEKFLNNVLILDLQFNAVTMNTGLSANDFQIQ
jgi:hypothetical protein